VVFGLEGLVGVLVPGLTALLLIVAARGSLRVRNLVAMIIALLGLASFFYQPHGHAAGVLVLALVVAGLAVALTGPLVAAPLAGVAGLIAAEYLPGLLSSHRHVSQLSVQAMHIALFAKPGTPTWLQLALLVVAAVPFALAARLVVRS
jgi:hypothetical protein